MISDYLAKIQSLHRFVGGKPIPLEIDSPYLKNIFFSSHGRTVPTFDASVANIMHFLFVRDFEQTR